MMHPTRSLLTAAFAVAVLAGASSRAHAQAIPDINGPIRNAHNAADATNRNISEQTGQALPRGTAPAPASGPGSAPAARATSSATAPSTQPPGAFKPVTREVFSYEPGGRRDPFFSLILTEDLRPLLSDLKLVGILYEAAGRKSVAIMRDVNTNAQYRVQPGQTLGRMRVTQIKPRAVLFTIDEFGLSRQDSLFLADTTKMRVP